MYPILTKLVHALNRDNYGIRVAQHEKPESEWEWPANAAKLEEIAERAELNATELETLYAGEYYDQKRLFKKKPKLRLIANFLGSVFDGELAENFLRF